MRKAIGIEMVLLLGAAGCSSVRLSPPPAQPSSPQPATLIVRTSQGQPFTQPCVIVQTGATVEWRNLTPLSPVDMISVTAPYEISSPALLSPYNEVPPDQSDECAQMATDGSCIEPLPFSYWRHTFSAVGIFDYYDSAGTVSAQQGTGGEYGMPSGTPTPASLATGTVCVSSSAAGTECNEVCCQVGGSAGQCASGVSCVGGRCGGITVSAAQ